MLPQSCFFFLQLLIICCMYSFCVLLNFLSILLSSIFFFNLLCSRGNTAKVFYLRSSSADRNVPVKRKQNNPATFLFTIKAFYSCKNISWRWLFEIYNIYKGVRFGTKIILCTKFHMIRNWKVIGTGIICLLFVWI